MQENTALTVQVRKITIRRDGQRLLLNDGRDGNIDTKSVPTAKALLRFMAARPIGETEGLQSWLLRCVEDYKAAVWVRLGRGRR